MRLVIIGRRSSESNFGANNTIGQAVPLIMKEVYACGKHINDLGNSVPKVRTNLCHSLFAE